MFVSDEMEVWNEKKSFKYYGVVPAQKFPLHQLQFGKPMRKLCLEFQFHEMFWGFKVFAWLNAMKIKGSLSECKREWNKHILVTVLCSSNVCMWIYFDIKKKKEKKKNEISFVFQHNKRKRGAEGATE